MEIQKTEAPSSKVLLHRGSRYTLTELAATYPKLTVIMGQIVDARIAGKSISELTDKELKVEADKAIFKISAICGAQLPQVDVFAEILTEEFLKFLIGFGYKDYTFEEIMLAFRLNASSSMRYPSGIEAERIEYSGAHFNIDYAAKILFNYSKFRDLTDRKFQNFIDGHE